MTLSEWLVVGVWAWVIWAVFAGKRKKNARSPDAPARGVMSSRGPAPVWLRHFSIVPARVVNIVRIDAENYSLDVATEEVRSTAARCFEEGRCRTLEFARFMVGESLQKDMRLYFARQFDGESTPNWYAFVAPGHWWRGGPTSPSLLKT